MTKFLSTTALVFAGTAAFADQAPVTPTPAVTLSGEIETVIAEGLNDKWGATTSFGFDGALTNGAATGSMEFVVDSDNDLTLDGWSMGTNVAGVAMSFGDQGNIWFDTESGATIEEPTMAAESLSLGVGSATVALAFTDIGTDVTDIANVQGAYDLNVGIANVTAAGDYNIDSKEWVVGGRADTAGMLDGVRLGGAATYGSASENIAFEADATVMGLTAYLAGDQDDLAQNIGGSYTYDLGGIDLKGAVDYDIDAETYAPSVTATFAF